MDPADQPSFEQRAIELEVKVAFLEETVLELSRTLAREVQEKLAATDRIALLEKALKVLAQRDPGRSGGTSDDVGADAATDPVPHSG
jgi:uncharacterized coiled-coil protein SlyX